MIELGLQLLYVSCFHCFQLLLCYGVLNGDGDEAVVVVVLGPPSNCQLRVHDFVLLYLLVLAIAAGFPVPQVVLAAANVLEFGELSVQCETQIHNAVRIVVYAFGEMPSLWSKLRIALIWVPSWWLCR